MRKVLLAVAIVFGLALPAFSLDARGLLLVHILTAAVALILGPLQFLPKIQARRRAHRTIGRLYLLAGVLPAGLTAIPVALQTGRPLTQVGLSIAGALWLGTGALAYRAARRRDFAAHRAWMMRTYALTFLAVTARLLVPVMLISQLPFGHRPDPQGLIPIGQTLGWIVNLMIAERLIRRRRTAS